ncbi:MAG: serine hydrolase [Rhodospirillaceae bacterium]|nr:serine hydrolase [Rhodospirillaceae bacterium]
MVDHSHLVSPPRDGWDRAPWNRWSFQHVREMIPTAEVWRGHGPARPLPRATHSLDDLAYVGESGARTIARFLDETYTDGFIVLHRGAVVFERYMNGMTERSLHLSQSVGKSLIGILVGIFVGRGWMDPDAPVTAYLPELAATAYRGATIRQILDMTSGVAFDETYTDPFSDIAKIDVAGGWRPRPENDGRDWPRTVWDVVLTLTKQEAEHGARFSYRSIETDVLAFALERVSGLRLPELVSRDLWQPLGAEESANYTVDESGYGLADGGFNATLRDYARFGEMLTRDGLFNDRQIVASEWVRGCRHGDHAKFTGDYRIATPHGAYARQFWHEDHRTPVLLCRGVFGQLIYSDPAHDFTAVKLSSWPDFRNNALLKETLAALNAIKLALHRN